MLHIITVNVHCSRCKIKEEKKKDLLIYYYEFMKMKNSKYITLYYKKFY